MKALIAVLALSPDVFRGPYASDGVYAGDRRQPAVDSVRWFAQAMAFRPGVRGVFAMNTAVKA